MIGLIRIVFVITAACLLMGGYVASQWAFFTGRAVQYASAVDAPPIQWLATILVLGAIGLRLADRPSPEDGA